MARRPGDRAEAHDELMKVLKSSEVQKQFDEQGVSAGAMSRDQLAEFIRKETVKWTKVAKDSGASAD